MERHGKENGAVTMLKTNKEYMMTVYYEVVLKIIKTVKIKLLQLKKYYKSAHTCDFCHFKIFHSY